MRRLAGRADVLVENFPPGGLEKFGLSLAELRGANPRLVTASITGYGRTGPESSAPGFDLLAQAGAGLMAITGEADGEATKVGIAVSDLLAGCYTAIGILAALAARGRPEQGRHVEVDLFSSTLASLINVAQSALLTGDEARRHGNAHPQIVPYRTFEASDGAFVLGVGTDPQFERLAALVGRPEWAGEGPFATNEARVTRREELEARAFRRVRGRVARHVGRAVSPGGHPGRTGARAARGAPLGHGEGPRERPRGEGRELRRVADSGRGRGAAASVPPGARRRRRAAPPRVRPAAMSGERDSGLDGVSSVLVLAALLVVAWVYVGRLGSATCSAETRRCTRVLPSGCSRPETSSFRTGRTARFSTSRR